MNESFLYYNKKACVKNIIKVFFYYRKLLFINFFISFSNLLSTGKPPASNPRSLITGGHSNPVQVVAADALDVAGRAATVVSSTSTPTSCMTSVQSGALRVSTTSCCSINPSAGGQTELAADHSARLVASSSAPPLQTTRLLFSFLVQRKKVCLGSFDINVLSRFGPVQGLSLSRFCPCLGYALSRFCPV